MPGPKPTPTAVLERRGSWLAKTRPDEPQPAPVTDLAPPAGLKGRAKKLWKEMAPRLIASGVLRDADVPAFTRYCQVYAAWEIAMAAVEDGGDRQAILNLSKLGDMLRKLEANFGLTPADRTGIKVEQPATDDKARFFAKAG
jgi:P27 family predicted phage terminase small subunit